MKILVVDTCGGFGSVALAEGSRVVAEKKIGGRRFAEELVPAVGELLSGAGLRVAELDVIGVVRGPGSFTGLRIGLSAVKGLSDASGVRVVAVSRLAVMARMAGGETVHAVMDGGRGEFYHGLYRGLECVSEGLLAAEALRAAVADEGAEVIISEEKLVDVLPAARLITEPVASDALALVLGMVKRGEFVELGALDGNYLRRTETIYAKPGVA